MVVLEWDHRWRVVYLKTNNWSTLSQQTGSQRSDSEYPA